MPKSNITEAARTAKSVEAMDITREFIAKGVDFLTVSSAFMAAQDALKIGLKWDRATNRGWVTAGEAAKIRKYMTENI